MESQHRIISTGVDLNDYFIPIRSFIGLSNGFAQPLVDRAQAAETRQQPTTRAPFRQGWCSAMAAMKLHQRAKIVMAFEQRLRNAMTEIETEIEAEFDGMTSLETIQALQNVLGDTISAICKYGIRRERHGNTDTPGDSDG